MDAAKQTINKLTGNHGHHETTVHEHYKPAVTHEQVAPTREHRDTTVVDKEIHQDHHHTTVLPVKDREVLPTEHTHQLAPQKHTEVSHGDHEGIKAKVAAETAQFTHHTETAPTEKTHTVAPTVVGEHHHHHVHETIQPVIQKQTIQPSVVHTTVPVHEVHHNEPKHYTASALPAVSMDEFKKQGGAISGLADRVERFEGEPENIATKNSVGHGNTGHGNTGLGNTGTGSAGGLGGRMGTLDNSTTTADKQHGTGLGHSNSHANNESNKPSLIDRINPFKDADHDGKKGMMD